MATTFMPVYEATSPYDVDNATIEALHRLAKDYERELAIALELLEESRSGAEQTEEHWQRLSEWIERNAVQVARKAVI